jgi:uncharacterized protein YkwD
MAKKLAKSKKIKDSDGDGLSDFDEINIFGSDPYNADSNGDGIEDGEAVLNGRDPVTGSKLKDFFIPHAGNNYQPHSLHPKRLLFHATSVLVVKLMLFILVFFYPMTAWMTPDVSAEEGRKIIALTNNLRKSLSLDVLTENQKLNQAATKKVEDMLINQYFAHQSPQGYDLEHFLKLASYTNYLTVGENLAIGYSDASEVMTAWENSPTHYSNLIDPNFKEIGVALAGGIYQEQETVFTAQYFGLPQAAVAPLTVRTDIKKVVNTAINPDAKAVLADKTEITPVAQDIKIIIDKPAGAKNEQVVKVEAVLPAETKNASLHILNNEISLAPVNETRTAGTTNWVGQALVEEPKIITPTIMTVSPTVGEVQKVEVSNSIKPQETSVASQYWLFKNHPNKGLAQIFDITSIYFKVLLGLVILATALNIFIQIKKQHPKVVFSSLGLIVFLVIMIIF